MRFDKIRMMLIAAAAIGVTVVPASAAAAAPASSVATVRAASAADWEYYGTYSNLAFCQIAGVAGAAWGDFRDWHCDNDTGGSYELWVRK